MVLGDLIAFNIDHRSHNIANIIITVDKIIVKALYDYILNIYKEKARVIGFIPGSTPLSYLEYSFRPSIIEHLKEVIFNHCVIHNLYKGILQNSLIVVGDPLLCSIELDPPHKDGQFVFECILVQPVAKDDWKKVIFKAPQRKNYKDLDRQVEFFMKDEDEKYTKHADQGIQLHDLVCFEVILIDENHKPLLENYSNTLWFRMSDEEIDKDVQSLFLTKKAGDSFFTDKMFFHDYLAPEHYMPYIFKITIKDYLSYAFFEMDYFRHHFKIKSAKDIHHKLIEVFSYRHDISQRRETVESSLKLLLNMHNIIIPEDLIVRQAEGVLDEVRENPDYHVYKAQRDFKIKIRMLAEKQLKERILIDYIAFQEKIGMEYIDILSYLNFFKRPRTKEFIYFSVPSTKIKEKEVPLSAEIIRQACLREKVLNHVIGHLIKK